MADFDEFSCRASVGDVGCDGVAPVPPGASGAPAGQAANSIRGDFRGPATQVGGSVHGDVHIHYASAGQPPVPQPVGWPVEELDDPLALEVHPSLEAPEGAEGPGVVPAYLPRVHDQQLKDVVAGVVGGVSAMAVLVGGSSTGKTRACWEALAEVPSGWRLWHPIDPTRPEAVLAAIQRVGPRTVVWLNEAQHYLASEIGERVASGLRELLRSPHRAPVLVLGTLWPEHWASLTSMPDDPTGPDPYSQARAVLSGTEIPVPSAFTSDERVRAGTLTQRDARWTLALEHAEEGQITQFLAGAPVLVERYHTAPPLVRALIEAAMDARRLGCGPALSRDLLTRAVTGYLTSAQRDLLLDPNLEPAQWRQAWHQALDDALASATRAARGIRGPLSPIRPEPSQPGESRTALDYRLADYLDDMAHHVHRGRIPPPAFWQAALEHADPWSQVRLAQRAHRWGMPEYAVPLGNSALADDPRRVNRLMLLLPQLDPEIVHTALEAADFPEPDPLTGMLEALRTVSEQSITGAEEAIQVVARHAAANVSLDDPERCARRLRALREVGAREAVEMLAVRAANASPLGQANASLIMMVLRELREAEAYEPYQVLAGRAAVEAPLHDPMGLASLLMELRTAGADDSIASLLARDPASHVDLDSHPPDPYKIHRLLSELQEVGAQEACAKLKARLRIRRDSDAHSSG